MRPTLVITAVLLTACAPAPLPIERAKPDPTKEPWYAIAAGQLNVLNGKAEDAMTHGRFDEAAALITQGQPIQERLLAVPRPTLAATEAAAGLDDLYGRMLLRNKHYGWARLLFQKNLARWRTWKPATAESRRRLKLAEEAIAECDRRLSE